MEVKDLEAIEVEDAQIVEDIPQELTEEQKKQTDKFLRSGIIRRFHYTLRTIDEELKKKNCTLEDLLAEVLAKESNLSRSQRDFLQGFKLDFIQQLIDDMHEMHRKAIERKYAIQS